MFVDAGSSEVERVTGETGVGVTHFQGGYGVLTNPPTLLVNSPG